ncbi:hypothetical protein [Ferroplasma acidarmanus]|uniref:Uncharacterized protein n=1 Tax=Ferroplasma acidarmanus Fer1 TaxID=333146 RepID=S0ALW2_FERAC|nr:hypothetical protein [Ferroplasma acidarmanus]AGO59996.1 hypothetical protein FACI_IFERC00001G0016 [Ferroplasma acidarmanus Fer1]
MEKLTEYDGVTTHCYVKSRKDGVLKLRAFCMKDTRPVVISPPEHYNFVVVVNNE